MSEVDLLTVLSGFLENAGTPFKHEHGVKGCSKAGVLDELLYWKT